MVDNTYHGRRDSGQTVQGLKMSANCVIVSMPPEGTASITSQVRRSLVSMEINAVGWAGPDLHVFLGKIN